jgi:hypothetical protein
MIRLIIGVLLLTTSAVSSAYTLDFEEFAPGSSASIYSPLISGDYEITANYRCDTPPVSCSAEVTAANTFRVIGDPYFFDIYAEFDLMRSDGGAFAVHAMDVLFDTGNGFLTGQTASGDFISGSLGDLGQGDWLNLVSFGYYTSIPDGTPIPAIIEVDNIVVGAAVPVPAAVWLFGSALAGLGFLRRGSVQQSQC